MIQRLVIHRFRGIREGVLEDLGKINLLIGPNNSGKTAILEMLYLGTLAGRDCDVVMKYGEPSAWPAKTLLPRDMLGYEAIPRLRVRHGESKKWSESPAYITEEKTLGIALEHLPEGHPLRDFELSLAPGAPGRGHGFAQADVQRISLFRLEPWADGGKTPDERLIPNLFDEYGVILDKGTWVYLWESPFVYKWDPTQPLDYLAIWAFEGKAPDPTKVLFFDFHSAEQHFLEYFASRAYKTIPDWEDKIARHIGAVFQELEDVRISVKPLEGRKWTGYVEWPNKTPIPIDHFGDGARHAFKVLAALVALAESVDEDHPGLFLWEDPELFMHPATLGRLLDAVMKIVADKPIQVFMTTQSLEMIAWIAHLATGLENMSEVQFYSLMLRNGELKSHKFDANAVLEWLKGGLDLREVSTGLIENFPLIWRLKDSMGGAPW
ncbi:MAG: AAA family ATPase [Ardenticatenia bacterium]|nr:AAA family ATPase [Ardenticatenia bacterium]